MTRKEVRNALETLPEGLDETYERILLAIDMETLAGQLAQRALVWLVAAVRKLQLSELMEALSINLRTRTLDSDFGPMHSGALLDACGSLVTYTEKTEIIILAHSSVKVNLSGGSFVCVKLTPDVGIPHRRVHVCETATVPHQLGSCTLTASPVVHVLYFYMPQTCTGSYTNRHLHLQWRLLST